MKLNLNKGFGSPSSEYLEKLGAWYGIKFFEVWRYEQVMATIVDFRLAATGPSWMYRFSITDEQFAHSSCPSATWVSQPWKSTFEEMLHRYVCLSLEDYIDQGGTINGQECQAVPGYTVNTHFVYVWRHDASPKVTLEPSGDKVFLSEKHREEWSEKMAKDANELSVALSAITFTQDIESITWDSIAKVVDDTSVSGVINYAQQTHVVREALPDLNTQVSCPDKEAFAASWEAELGRHFYRATIWAVIQHLNDEHRWPRERIADWLETLDVDLSFPVPDERR